MVVQLLPNMASSNDIPMSGGASVHSVTSEESHHHSVSSHLLDGELTAGELNEIPELPAMPEIVEAYDFDPAMVSSLLDESHPATQIAITASALDNALAGFELLPSTTAEPAAVLVPKAVPMPILPAANAPTAEETSKGKKRTSTSKKAGPTKKRKVTNKEAHGSPVISAMIAMVEPPALNSPSASSAFDRTVTPPLSPVHVFPVAVQSGITKPLFPKPSTEVFAPSPTTTSAPAPAPAKQVKTNTAPSKQPMDSFISSDHGPVNISTEHIHMLTSENGPVECAKAVVTVTTGTDGRRVSKSHLSQEQRAQASRDRNREHARNTRLRKKAYVEELKRTLMALCAQRDADTLAEQRKTKLEEQHRNVRFSVLQEFLRLKGNNIQDPSRWSAILVPSFTMRMPTITAQELVEEKTLAGVPQAMEEASDFGGFLQTVGGKASSLVTLQYTLGDRSSLFMDGNNAVLEWNATTVGAVANGATREMTIHGNIKAQFDPESNKVVGASMLFDSGSILAQKRAVAP